VAGFAAGGGNYVGRFRAERPEFAQGAHRKETVRQYSVGRWPVNFSRGREAKDLLSRALSRKQVLRFTQNHKSQRATTLYVQDTIRARHRHGILASGSNWKEATGDYFVRWDAFDPAQTAVG
jgi:hypothetical protein